MNHEASKVPFSYNVALPTAANGENDFDDSKASHLVLNRHSAGVLNGSFAIPSSAGYQRFCASYLATAKEGFDRDILFQNEEGIDYVKRQESSWPPAIGDPNEKQIGLVVALDIRTGKYKAIPRHGPAQPRELGRDPGFDDLVVLSGDDTFTNGSLNVASLGNPRSRSRLYSYIAPDTDSLLADKGELWAFVSDDLSYDDYYDFVPGSAQTVSGRFIQVPKNIAIGLDSAGSELKGPRARRSPDARLTAASGRWCSTRATRRW